MILYERKDKETGKEYAYRVLKGNIMSLELKPGEFLSELELADKLNLSRTPIREVIMKLKGEHLIEVKPQSGTYVSLIDIDLIEEAIFMRFAVEEKILKLACESFPSDIMLELEKNIFAQEIIADMKGGETEFHKLDTSFHELLFKGTGKARVWDNILNISTHYNRMRLLTQKKDSKKSVVEQHKEFLNVIKNKDKDKVEFLIDEHMRFSMKSWDYLIKHDSEISKYFK
ncbi:GntR family transcriptional regulator [Romboutsia sp. CE17]|uniref:GntR family transcriptional regulator n=1 Tax=Romboutsia sp. CE17 TaxID=2724150 RepID=UPI001442E5F5|nr:GntR family transcriptional regulator [Romboutsia sp. CE17]QJA07782.1 GntR family transcriptional regulator [Romboutsia sp. CE17]